MIESASCSHETVLVLAPTFNDSMVAVDVLNEFGISALACKSVQHLCEYLRKECGAVIISEEAIDAGDVSILQDIMEAQAPWSDIPIILLTSSDMVHAIEFFSNSGNISLLERPFSQLTLIRAAQVALRARNKQYEVRDLLKAVSQSKIDAERANRLKTQFLANMSHEIRTPIGAILGFIDLMKHSVDYPKLNLNYMGIVERNSQQLLTLIDDILDLSKVEAGKMTIENIQFSLSEMLTDFISVMGFKAREKGIEFKNTLDTLIPDLISSDPVRLRQILTNIVGNALKFTDKGHVELRVAYKNPTLSFTVADTGIGISNEQRSQLFQPFTQADASTTRKYGGTGLGLVLSKSLSGALGGNLDLVDTAQNVGSTFLINIHSPLVPNAKLVDKNALSLAVSLQKAGTSQSLLKGLKVLLVEDSSDNQLLITTYLENEGAQVKIAANGEMGMKFALSEHFHLILMDIQMPVLDGHEATQRLREMRYAKPIIALTAHAMKEEQAKCFESGFNDFLTKPIQRDLLVDVLSRYVP